MAPWPIPTNYRTTPFLDGAMGWTESPPYFCAFTETIADVANQRIQRHWKAPPHRLEALSSIPPPDEPASGLTTRSTTLSVPKPSNRVRSADWRSKAVAAFDIFVDDFIGLAQGNQTRRLELTRILLHSLDEVFRALHPEVDGPYRKEPASVKKLKLGDAHWCTRKLVLGWLIDTLQMTLELPPHRQQRLTEDILDSIPPHQKRVSLKKWHQVLGKLRSMSIALPGSRGLFSLLQFKES